MMTISLVSSKRRRYWLLILLFGIIAVAVGTVPASAQSDCRSGYVPYYDKDGNLRCYRSTPITIGPSPDGNTDRPPWLALVDTILDNIYLFVEPVVESQTDIDIYPSTILIPNFDKSDIIRAAIPVGDAIINDSELIRPDILENLLETLDNQ